MAARGDPGGGAAPGVAARVRHKATVSPVRTRFQDEDTGTVTVRGIGYRASCPCSWRGRFRVSFPLARADAASHNRETRPGA